MAYRISDKAIIIEEDGESILVAESVNYDSDITIGSTDYTLAPDYIDNYFSSSAIGQSHGFVAGGLEASNDIVQRFSFASGSSESWTIDEEHKEYASGFSSGNEGFIAAGAAFEAAPDGTVAPYVYQAFGTNTIRRFSFASSNSSVDEVGTLSSSLSIPAAPYSPTLKVTMHSIPVQSSSHGYLSGGRDAGGPFANQAFNSISKFSLSSVSTQADVGDQTVARNQGAGSSSANHGYTVGGTDSPPFVVKNTIDKFPFSSDANATDVGDLTASIGNNVGHQSTTNGYSSGGATSPPFTPIDMIQKFPFSSDGNATDIANLTSTRTHNSASSSSSGGFNVGGIGPNPAGAPNHPLPTTRADSTIQKFPFSSDADATDVGNLVTSAVSSTGHQV